MGKFRPKRLDLGTNCFTCRHNQQSRIPFRLLRIGNNLSRCLWCFGVLLHPYMHDQLLCCGAWLGWDFVSYTV